MKIKVDDTIVVISGKDRGKTGKVIRVYQKINKIVVEKINIRTKHIKKTTTRPGEIIRFEAPFDVSNVKVICPRCKKATRVSYLKLKDKKKQRICKKCKESIDQLITTKTTRKTK